MLELGACKKCCAKVRELLYIPVLPGIHQVLLIVPGILCRSGRECKDRVSTGVIVTTPTLVTFPECKTCCAEVGKVLLSIYSTLASCHLRNVYVFMVIPKRFLHILTEWSFSVRLHLFSYF